MELSAATAALQRRMGLQSPPGIPGGGSPPRRSGSLSPLPISLHRMQQHQQQLKYQLQQFQHSALNELTSMKLEQSSVMGLGYGGSPGCSAPSPPPVSSNPENNTCRLIDYRGVKVAAFNVDGRELICLPQAFELFLKHLVGGLHTVYTKLKRLDVIPVVCNVEQVRVLRGLGAIQPGVNRCKLISPKEFDILYDDCTNSSARPGRPPKRSALSTTPDTLEKFKKTHRLQLSPADYYQSANPLLDPKKSLPFSTNGYLHCSSQNEIQKSAINPLMAGGFPYPPHLANLFMPLGHPGMMNLAMASHLNSMRAEQMLAAATAAAREAALPGSSGGLFSGALGSRDSLAFHRDGPAGSSTLNSSRNTGPDDHTSSENNNNGASKLQAPPPRVTSDMLDRPLNLETHKRFSIDEETGTRSNSSDRESATASSERSRFNIGQLLGRDTQQFEKLGQQNQQLREKLGQSQLMTHARYNHSDDDDDDDDVRDAKDLDERSVTSIKDDNDYDNDDNESNYERDVDDEGQKENKSTNKMAGFSSAGQFLDNQQRKFSPRTLEDICNGSIRHGAEGRDDVTAVPPYLYQNTGDVTSLESLLVHIFNLVKMAVDKSQAFCYETADLKMKAAKERRLREESESRLRNLRKVKDTLLKKLRRERRNRRKFQGARIPSTVDKFGSTGGSSAHRVEIAKGEYPRAEQRAAELGVEINGEFIRGNSPLTKFRQSPIRQYPPQIDTDYEKEDYDREREERSNERKPRTYNSSPDVCRAVDKDHESREERKGSEVTSYTQQHDYEMRGAPQGSTPGPYHSIPTSLKVVD